MDEVSLVGASREGDRIAFSSLIDLYYKNIYRLAYQYTGSHHEADDVCQETFLQAFDNIGKLRDGNCFKGWIFMIASNLLRKRIKQIKRERNLAAKIPGSDNIELIYDRTTEPFETLSSKEKAITIHKLLQEMSEHMRLVTILILMEGLTQKDAAGIMNCSEASVSRHLETARQWLRVKLENLI